MKNLIVLSLLLTSFVAKADKEMVPLNIELGYWQSTIELEENDMIRDMLAGMPESQREMIRKTMKNAMASQTTNQCVTKESLKDMEKQMKESIGNQSGEESCDFKITKSTATEFVGEMNCKGVPTTVHTKVINPKRHESYATSIVPGAGESKVKVVGEWQSENCPAGS